MSNRNEVFEYLIDQLRQQVDNSPYKQQCEDLAHEAQSLKNQLRDASAQIKELHLALVKAVGGAEAYKLICKQEQSGCRKEDVRECHHNWRFVGGKSPAVCINCGVTQSEECEHDWYFYDTSASMMCKKCGLKK